MSSISCRFAKQKFSPNTDVDTASRGKIQPHPHPCLRSKEWMDVGESVDTDKATRGLALNESL
jgi:hypothetical protein